MTYGVSSPNIVAFLLKCPCKPQNGCPQKESHTHPSLFRDPQIYTVNRKLTSHWPGVLLSVSAETPQVGPKKVIRCCSKLKGEIWGPLRLVEIRFSNKDTKVRREAVLGGPQLQREAQQRGGADIVVVLPVLKSLGQHMRNHTLAVVYRIASR